MQVYRTLLVYIGNINSYTTPIFHKQFFPFQKTTYLTHYKNLMSTAYSAKYYPGSSNPYFLLTAASSVLNKCLGFLPNRIINSSTSNMP